MGMSKLKTEIQNNTKQSLVPGVMSMLAPFLALRISLRYSISTRVRRSSSE